MFFPATAFCSGRTVLPASAMGDFSEVEGAPQSGSGGRLAADDVADAAGDDIGECGLAILAEEIAVVRGDGFEVCSVCRAERFEAGEGFLEMAAGPRTVTGFYIAIRRGGIARTSRDHLRSTTRCKRDEAGRRRTSTVHFASYPWETWSG